MDYSFSLYYTFPALQQLIWALQQLIWGTVRLKLSQVKLELGKTMDKERKEGRKKGKVYDTVVPALTITATISYLLFSILEPAKAIPVPQGSVKYSICPSHR